MCKQCPTSIFRFNISFPLFYSFLFSSSFNLQISVPQGSFSGFSLLQGRVLNQICLFSLLTLFSIETTNSLQQLSDGEYRQWMYTECVGTALKARILRVEQHLFGEFMLETKWKCLSGQHSSVPRCSCHYSLFLLESLMSIGDTQVKIPCKILKNILIFKRAHWESLQAFIYYLILLSEVQLHMISLRNRRQGLEWALMFCLLPHTMLFFFSFSYVNYLQIHCFMDFG